MQSALQSSLDANLEGAQLIHDHPYGITEVRADGTYLRKYPTGDCMDITPGLRDGHKRAQRPSSIR